MSLWKHGVFYATPFGHTVVSATSGVATSDIAPLYFYNFIFEHNAVWKHGGFEALTQEMEQLRTSIG